MELTGPTEATRRTTRDDEFAARHEEMQVEDPDGSSAPSGTTAPEFSLPPVDKGKDAWLVLAACFVLEALVWGFPFSFGVFNDYYARMPEFEGHTSAIAAIGTTATGIMYEGALVIYPLLRRYPALRKPFTIGGEVILVIALIAASFAQTLPQLLATQGIMYAIGGSVNYFPAFLYMDEWFAQRKGLAYGVVWAGGGLSGFVLPLTLSRLLDLYGFRTTLRIWAVVSVVLTVPAVYCLKPRVPLRHATASAPRTVELRFLRVPAFWILMTGNMLQGAGYYLPTLYMPSFARAVGLSAESGTIAVSIANGCTMLGAIMTGWLVDRYHVTTAINFCAIGTVIAVFLFWSFAVSQPVLYIFAILYGVFAGGFSATWSGVTGILRGRYPSTETGMVIAMFAATKGLGAMVSGPLSGVLIDADKWKDDKDYAWGSGYGLLILVSGVTAASTGVGWCAKRAGLM